MSTQVELTLVRIKRNILQCGPLINNRNYRNAKRLLLQCRTNLNRISSMISPRRFNIINDNITTLCNICDEQNDVPLAEVAYTANRQSEGRVGRPSVSLTRVQLNYFLREEYTATQIAKHLKCSKSLVYKRMYQEGLKFRNRYSHVSDDELFTIISDLHKEYPNSGCEMMTAYLKTRGFTIQRKRVRNMLATVDPVGTAGRWSCAVKRRIYSVPSPNSLWHMDAHLKLIRWGFVTHACIDGFSRLIIYAKCTTSITANTVLNIFIPGIIKYGLPSRVRSDHGYENFFVAVLMNALRGAHRGSHITGKSVHNQRIERLWRDIFQQVIHRFYTELYSLETEEELDPQNNTHRFVIQSIYLNEINKALEVFVSAWNRHRIRTENQRNPRQIWLDGMLNNFNSDQTAVNEVFQEQPNIYRRVRTAISSLGVNCQDQVIQIPEQSSLTAEFSLTIEQQASLQNIIATNLSSREKYIQGISLLLI